MARVKRTKAEQRVWEALAAAPLRAKTLPYVSVEGEIFMVAFGLWADRNRVVQAVTEVGFTFSHFSRGSVNMAIFKEAK